jgi:hypothetical protein
MAATLDRTALTELSARCSGTLLGPDEGWTSRRRPPIRAIRGPSRPNYRLMPGQSGP